MIVSNVCNIPTNKFVIVSIKGGIMVFIAFKISNINVVSAPTTNGIDLRTINSMPSIMAHKAAIIVGAAIIIAVEIAIIPAAKAAAEIVIIPTSIVNAVINRNIDTAKTANDIANPNKLDVLTLANDKILFKPISVSIISDKAPKADNIFVQGMDDIDRIANPNATKPNEIGINDQIILFMFFILGLVRSLDSF